MQIAVRHCAVETNPVDGVSSFTRRSTRARGKAGDQDALPGFRAQVRAWASGETVPGTPAYTSGPPRDWSVVWVTDLTCGTGLCSHEVFAVLLEEIDLDATIPYLDVTGTLVEVKGSGTGGWVRQPFPKSANGWRRILLPEHSAQACREALKDLEVTGQPNPTGSCFPHATVPCATRTTSGAAGAPHVGRTTTPGSLRRRSGAGSARRSTTPTAIRSGPRDNSATPKRWPRLTTSISPKRHPTTGRFWSGGRGESGRKREISVRNGRFWTSSVTQKIPSDPGRRGFLGRADRI